MPTSVDNLIYLRGLFPQQQLAYLKTVAAYYKNDVASLEAFVRSAVESNHFAILPNQPDTEMEEYLSGQRQTLKELLPDAEEEYLQVLFDENVCTNNFGAVALDAIASNSYPKKVVLKEKVEEDFNVELYCKLIPDPVGSYSHANYIMTDNMKAEATDYLVKIFGEDKRTMVCSHVEEEGSLYLAFKKMREEVGEADGQLCRDAAKSVQPKTFDEAPDYLQVFEKLFIENEGVVLSYLEKRRADEEELLKQQESAQSLQECGICCSDTPSCKLMKICDNGHMMCASCVKDYTELLFHQAILFFPCSFDCKLFLPNSVIRSVWDTSRYSKLLEDRISSKTKDIIACPWCKYGNEESKNQEILCKHCNKKFCVLCKKTAHSPLQCHQKANDLCKSVEEAMTDALVRKCPRCNIKFIKEANCCNRIQCTHCATFLCYICRKIVSGASYAEHFYGQGIQPSEAKGKCPLHSDINHLHVYNVKKTGETAYEKLKQENPDLELLYNPLDKPPVAGKSDAVPNQF